MKIRKPAKPPGRLSRELWLRKALDILAREGGSKLRVAAISQALGVTKGSFYWHFDSRSDFVHAILDYWQERFTRRVREEAERQGGSARERLKYVMGLVMVEDLSKYDATLEAWACNEPDVAPAVHAVHRFRYDYIRSLFAEMGFEDSDLHLRTIAFLGFLKHHSIIAKLTKRVDQETDDIDLALALFTEA